MSQVLWTAQEIAEATGGIALGTWDVSGVAIHSQLAPGELFVPLRGARDGHEFIDQAIANGAAGVLSARPGVVENMVHVSSTELGLDMLAQAAKRRASAVRIGITGSVGKTTTTRFLDAVLGQVGRVHASQKSYNNHIGVPLTLARMPRESEYALFEMGMNHAGELGELSTLVEPDMAVIMTVGKAHLGHFESVREIARAKAEIMQGMASGSLVILPRDSEYYDLLETVARAKRLRIVSVGVHLQADCRWVDYNSSEIRIFYRDLEFSLPNSQQSAHFGLLVAIATVLAGELGLDITDLRPAMLTWQLPAGRGRVEYVRRGEDKYTLIDDTYNANPTSMRGALARLGQYSGYTVAIIGAMGELGRHSDSEHEALAKVVEAVAIDLVICVGSATIPLFNALKQDKYYYRTTAEAADSLALRDWPADSTVLAKGSRTMRLELVLDSLRQ